MYLSEQFESVWELLLFFSSFSFYCIFFHPLVFLCIHRPIIAPSNADLCNVFHETVYEKTNRMKMIVYRNCELPSRVKKCHSNMWWRQTNDNNDNTNKMTTFRAMQNSIVGTAVAVAVVEFVFLIEYVSLLVYICQWGSGLWFSYSIELNSISWLLLCSLVAYSSHYFAIIAFGTLCMLQACISAQSYNWTHGPDSFFCSSSLYALKFFDALF